jgi:hypothetical protein
MMKLTRSGSLADIYQIVDLTSYADAIDAGQVSTNFSAYFNAPTAVDVGRNIIGWDADPDNFSGITSSSGNIVDAVTTDNQVATWE